MATPLAPPNPGPYLRAFVVGMVVWVASGLSLIFLSLPTAVILVLALVTLVGLFTATLAFAFYGREKGRIRRKENPVPWSPR